MTAIDHCSLSVTDYTKSKVFYEAALAPLGMNCMMEFDFTGGKTAGFGSGKPDFWIASALNGPGHSHVAFAASSRAVVDAFHQAALAAGARDNGAPGLRPLYHPDYYGAFVLDPDGHNIEAVCHAPA